MYLDKATKELVLKFVYAGDGKGPLGEVSALAAKTKPGSATPVVVRLHDSVRTFTLSMSAVKVRGCAVRIEVVGVSLDGLRVAMGKNDGDDMEKTILKADAMIFVVGPMEPSARATFERARALLATLGCNGAKTPTAIIATGGVDAPAVLGVTDMPITTGNAACITALTSLVKPMLLDVVEQLGD